MTIDRRIEELVADNVVSQGLSDLGNITQSIGSFNNNPAITATGAQMNFAITKKNFYESLGMSREEYKARPTEGIARAAIYQASHLASDIAKDTFRILQSEYPEMSHDELVEKAVAEGTKYAQEIFRGLKTQEESGYYLASLASADSKGRLVAETYGRSVSTPLTRGVDIGSPFGAFIAQAGESSFLFKALYGIWNQDRVAALLEANKDQARYGLDGMLGDTARKTAGIVGTATTFIEMMAAAKVGGLAGSIGKGAAAIGKSKAALGSGGYYLINSALNDTMYRRGAATRYFKATDTDPKRIGAWVGSRVHDIATYWITMGLTGPNQTHALTQQLSNLSTATFGNIFKHAMHPVVNVVTDSLLDTTIDFGTFLAADLFVGREIFTQESQRLFGLDSEQLFSKENLEKFGNMWLRRAFLRTANSMIAKPLMASAGDAIRGTKRRMSSQYEDVNWWRNEFIDQEFAGKHPKATKFLSSIGAFTYKHFPQNLSTMKRVYEANPQYWVRKGGVGSEIRSFDKALATGELDPLMITTMFIESERIVNAIYDLSVEHDLITHNPGVNKLFDLAGRIRGNDLEFNIGDLKVFSRTSEANEELSVMIQAATTEFLERSIDNYIRKNPDLASYRDILMNNVVHKATSRDVTADQGKKIEKAIKEIHNDAARKTASLIFSLVETDDGSAFPRLSLQQKLGDRMFSAVSEVLQTGKYSPDDAEEMTDVRQKKRDILLDINALEGGKFLQGRSERFAPYQGYIADGTELDIYTRVTEFVETFGKFIEDMETKYQDTDFRKLFPHLAYFRETTGGTHERTRFTEEVMQLYNELKNSGNIRVTSMLDLIVMKDIIASHAAKELAGAYRKLHTLVKTEVSKEAIGEQAGRTIERANWLSLMFGHRFTPDEKQMIWDAEKVLKDSHKDRESFLRILHDSMRIYAEAHKDLAVGRMMTLVPFSDNTMLAYKGMLLKKSLFFSDAKDRGRVLQDLSIQEKERFEEIDRDYHKHLLTANNSTPQPTEGFEVEIRYGDAYYGYDPEHMSSVARLFPATPDLQADMIAIVLQKAYARHFKRVYERDIFGLSLGSYDLTDPGTKSSFESFIKDDILDHLVGRTNSQGISIEVSRTAEGTVLVSLDINNKEAYEDMARSGAMFVAKHDTLDETMKTKIYREVGVREHDAVFDRSGESFDIKTMVGSMMITTPGFLTEINDFVDLSVFRFRSYRGPNVTTAWDRTLEYVKQRLVDIVGAGRFDDDNLTALAHETIRIAANENTRNVFTTGDIQVKTLSGGMSNMKDMVMLFEVSSVAHEKMEEQQILDTIESVYKGIRVVRIGPTNASYRNMYIGTNWRWNELSTESGARRFKQTINSAIQAYRDSVVEPYRALLASTPDNPSSELVAYVDAVDKLYAELNRVIESRNVTSEEEGAKLMFEVLEKIDRHRRIQYDMIQDAAEIEQIKQEAIKYLRSKNINLPGPTKDQTERYAQQTKELAEILFKRVGAEATATATFLGNIFITFRDMAKNLEGEPDSPKKAKVSAIMEMLRNIAKGIVPDENLTDEQRIDRLVDHITAGTKEVSDFALSRIEGLAGVAFHMIDLVQDYSIEMRGTAMTFLDEYRNRYHEFQVGRLKDELEVLQAAYNRHYAGYDAKAGASVSEEHLQLMKSFMVMQDLISKSHAKNELTRDLDYARDRKVEMKGQLEQLIFLFGLTNGRSMYAGETKRTHLSKIQDTNGHTANINKALAAILAYSSSSGNTKIKIGVTAGRSGMATDLGDGSGLMIKELFDHFGETKVTGGMGISKIALIPFDQSTKYKMARGFEGYHIILDASTLKAVAPELMQMIVASGDKGVSLTDAAYILGTLQHHVDQRASIEKRSVYNNYSMRDIIGLLMMDRKLTQNKHRAGEMMYGPKEITGATRITKNLVEQLDILDKQLSAYQQMKMLADEPHYRISSKTRAPFGRTIQKGSFDFSGQMDVPIQTLLRLVMKQARSKDDADTTFLDILYTRSGVDTSRINKDRFMFLVNKIISTPKTGTDTIEREMGIRFKDLAKAVVDTLVDKDQIMKAVDRNGKEYYFMIDSRHSTEHSSHYLPTLLRGVAKSEYGDHVAVSEMFKMLNHGDFDGDQTELKLLSKTQYATGMERYFNRNVFNEDKTVNDQRLLEALFEREADVAIDAIRTVHADLIKYPPHSTPVVVDQDVGAAGASAIHAKRMAYLFRSSGVIADYYMRNNSFMKSLLDEYTDALNKAVVGKDMTQTTIDTLMSEGMFKFTGPETYHNFIMFRQDGKKLTTGIKDIVAFHATSTTYLPMHSVKNKDGVTTNQIKLYHIEGSQSLFKPTTEGRVIVTMGDESGLMGERILFISQDSVTIDQIDSKAIIRDLQEVDPQTGFSLAQRISDGIQTLSFKRGKLNFINLSKQNLRGGLEAGFEAQWQKLVGHVGDIPETALHGLLKSEGKNFKANMRQVFDKIAIAQNINWLIDLSSNELKFYAKDSYDHFLSKFRDLAPEKQQGYMDKFFLNTMHEGERHTVDRLYVAYVNDTSLFGRGGMELMYNLLYGKDVLSDPKSGKFTIQDFYAPENLEKLRQLEGISPLFRMLNIFADIDVEKTFPQEKLRQYIIKNHDDDKDDPMKMFENAQYHKWITMGETSNRDYQLLNRVQIFNNITRGLPLDYLGTMMETINRDPVIVPTEHKVHNLDSLIDKIFQTIYSDDVLREAQITRYDIHKFLSDDLEVNIDSSGREHTKIYEAGMFLFMPYLNHGNRLDVQSSKQTGFLLSRAKDTPLTIGTLSGLILSHMTKLNTEAGKNSELKRNVMKGKAMATALMSLLDIETQAHTMLSSIGVNDPALRNMLTLQKEEYLDTSQVIHDDDDGHYRIKSRKLLEKIDEHFKFDLMYLDRVRMGLVPMAFDRLSDIC